MENKHLISITDFSKEEIFRILDLAEDFEKIQIRIFWIIRLLLRYFLNHPHAPA